MRMLTVNKFWYLIQVHCRLSSWSERHPLQKENEKTLGDFIFEKSISMPQDRNRLKEKRVGVLRPQVNQLSSLPMRWHVVARLSHDAQVILGCSHVIQGHEGVF